MGRGAYFAAPTIGNEWSISLMSAYYPVVLTGASLIVCFWAEVFHLQEIRWDRPRFLSKSFLGFVAFNIISYSLLIAELVLIWFGQEHLHFYKHIFNGSYAVLMFIVVIFFLIYGVEVFFKVRGGFTVTRVPAIIARRKDLKKVKTGSFDDNQESGEMLLVNPNSLEPKAETEEKGPIEPIQSSSPQKPPVKNADDENQDV